MAITPVPAAGNLQSNAGNGVKTFQVTTNAIGNVLLCGVSYDNTLTLNSITGGGLTWSKVASWNETSAFGVKLEIWMAPVTAVINTLTTMTANFAVAPTTSNYLEFDSQEFTNGDSTTTWALDGTFSTATNTKDNTTASTHVACPSLTPSTGSTDVYFGKNTLGSGTMSSVTPTGFKTEADASSDGVVFSNSALTPGTAYAPSITISASAQSAVIAVLISATTSGGGGGGGGGGTPTITHVGTFANAGSATPPTTIPITTQNLGDLVVLTDATSSGSSYATAVSGGGVGSWQLVVLDPSTSGIATGVTMWVGTVTSPPGAETITVTRTGSPGGCQIDVDQFTAGLGASTLWVVESSGIVAATTGTTTIAYPTLSASVAGSLYCGYAVTSGNGSAGPAGFTYNVDNYFIAVRCYSTTVAVGSVSPTATTAGTANYWTSLGAIFTATLPTAIGRSFPIRQAVARASFI